MEIPESPGIVTPLAPITESMTPCAKTLVAANATRKIADEYCILRCVWNTGAKGSIRDSEKVGANLRPALGWNRRKMEEEEEEAEGG